MARRTLSVNLNKVALLRNSRDIGVPNLIDAARVVIDNGANGVTLHPRADARHATLDDVLAIAEMPEVKSGTIEFNIEGDLRPELLRLAKAVKATQFTVVPVTPGELTSRRGWRAYDDQNVLVQTVENFHGVSRVSVFCDAADASVRLAAGAGVDAVEFYTGDYALSFGTPRGDEFLAQLEQAANLARTLGLRVHAGHDLTQENLPALIKRIRPDELSIGHAIISESLSKGLAQVVREYVACVNGA
ncbi:MAG: pyridoxine 5-phosphate synthase [Acidobacteriota bacterium]|jgi:pyridoxine 5-phosphate synthase